MKDLRRRLRKLERFVVDSNGLVAGSQKWREYWHEKIHEYASADHEGPQLARPLIPLKAFREFIQNAPDDGHR